MRVVNKDKRYITYTLNILGLRVYEGLCELIARHGEDWVSIGNAKTLPIQVPDTIQKDSDPFLLTIVQYASTFPDSDLLCLLEGKRSIEQALVSAAP